MTTCSSYLRKYIKNMLVIRKSFVMVFDHILSLSSVTLNVNDNHFYCIRAAEFNCLYFCPHFYKAFKRNITIESAEIIESLGEAL